jgi:hypothetical protein
VLQPLAQPFTVRLIWFLNVRGAIVRTTYRSPRVIVIDPPLARRAERPDEEIPHLYQQPTATLPAHLCLYWPDGEQFNADMYLAETILPWSSEWLTYYELWQITGEWAGPEAPHESDDTTDRSASALPRHFRSRFPETAPLLTAHPYLLATQHPVVSDTDELAAA